MKTLKITIYHIDAFTDKLFGGNPAAVCLLDQWLSDNLLLKIAAENFLPETAFLVPGSETGLYHIRWFTPEIEMDLCGHATLAAAHVVFQHLGFSGQELCFESASGSLIVTKQDNLLTLDFPSRMPAAASLPAIIEQGLGTQPIEVLKSRDYVLVYEREEEIRNIVINQEIINQINLDPGGIIVTAKGKEVDFVSRFFTPQASIFEDPVTGSAHCSLIPYWSQKLGKKELTALQVSPRLGKLNCVDAGERVLISGECVTYMEGVVYLS